MWNPARHAPCAVEGNSARRHGLAPGDGCQAELRVVPQNPEAWVGISRFFDRPVDGISTGAARWRTQGHRWTRPRAHMTAASSAPAKEAEDYIVDYPEGVPKGVPIDIVLHLAAEECPRAGSSELVSAIKDYFGLRSHVRDERRRVAPSVIETSHVSAHQTRRIRCPLPASLNSAF